MSNIKKSSLREIFADAAEIADAAERAAFLERACAGDRALRQKVERLLAADAGAGNFLRTRATLPQRVWSRKSPETALAVTAWWSALGAAGVVWFISRNRRNRCGGAWR